MEGDSKCLCDALLGWGETASSVQNIVAGTIHLAQAFRNIVFSHTKRQANVPPTCWPNMQLICMA